MDKLRDAALEILKRKKVLEGKDGHYVYGITHRLIDAMLEFLIEVQPEELDRLSKVEKVLNQTVSTLEEKVRELKVELVHSEYNFKAVMHEIGEKEILAEAFDKIRKIFAGREWITQGRGCYPYDDDRYKEEVRYLLDDFEKISNDTWANIRTKTFEYKKKLIDQYESELKEENKLLREIIHKFQKLCLVKNPDLNEILKFSKEVKNGYGYSEI